MMLVVHKVGVGQAAYYLDERSQGRWAGAGCGGLGLTGLVEARPFLAALSGCDPDGHLLLRRRSPTHRAGFDLIFAAPKSVSLLAAFDRPDMGSSIVTAHDNAVVDTLGYLERWATWTRRGKDARRIPTSGLIAAGFRHGLSWSGDPHLHTHLVVANLVRGEDATWSCLDSRSIYRHRRAATAVYQASLRHQLDQAGFNLGWTLRQTGLADVVGVPRAAIDACSTRQRAILDDDDGFMPASGAARRVAAGRTRHPDQLPSDSWRARAAAGGLGAEVASALLAPSPAGTRPPDATSRVNSEVTGARRSGGPAEEKTLDLDTIVDRQLSSTVSSFDHSDCVRLAAAHLRYGAPAQAVEAWASRFMDRVIREANGRWVTPTLARRADQLAGLVAQPSTRAGLAKPETVARALVARPGLDDGARRAVERLTTSGACVERLGYGSFLTQAAVIEAAQEAWSASGHRVVVMTQTARGADRWRALSGLEGPPAPPHHPSVIIVDNADRLCTAELHRVIADGTSRQAKVILVEGGSGPAPRRSAEPAFARLRHLLPAVEPGSSLVPLRESAPVLGGLDESVAVVSTSHDAFNALVADWAAARAASRPAVMVALGPAEAGALNTLARRHLATEGVLSGPQVSAGGKQWRAGDEFRLLRRHPLFGPATAGTLGTVTAVDPAAKSVTIGWPAGSMTVPAKDFGRAPVTHAYATTPPYLRYWHGGPVLSLGDVSPRQLWHLERPNLYLVAHPPNFRDATSGPVARMVSELGTAAPRDPDRYQAWSLRQLADRRKDLDDRLENAAPPDVGPERRRLDDERAWQQARGGDTRDIDQRAQVLREVAEARRQWLDAHAGELNEWVSLGEAMSRRGGLLTVAAEARPSRTVQAEIGALPAEADERARAEWRRAAQALECYRDRWGLADDPDQLRTTPAQDGIDPTRRHDLVRAVAASRSVSRGPALSRGPPGSRRTANERTSLRPHVQGVRLAP